MWQRFTRKNIAFTSKTLDFTRKAFHFKRKTRTIYHCLL